MGQILIEAKSHDVESSNFYQDKRTIVVEHLVILDEFKLINQIFIMKSIYIRNFVFVLK